jgi:putative transcriptional regulator
MSIEVRITKCKLRDRRLAAGYTQMQLAHLAGINKARISEYERGPKDVHLSTAIKFCIILNCNIDDLFEFEVIRKP